MWYAAQISEHSKVENKVEVQDPAFPDDPKKTITVKRPSSSWVIRITPYAKTLNLQPGMAVYCEFLPSVVFDDPFNVPAAFEAYRERIIKLEKLMPSSEKRRPVPRLPLRTVRVVREHGAGKRDQPAALAISCKRACRRLHLKPGDWIYVRILGAVKDIKDWTHQTRDGKTYHRKRYEPDMAFYRYAPFECIPVPCFPEAVPQLSPDSSPEDEGEDLDDLRRVSVALDYVKILHIIEAMTQSGNRR